MTLHDNASSAAAAAKAAVFEDPLAAAAAQFGVLGAQLLRSKEVPSVTLDAARDAVRKLEEIQLKPAAFAALAAAHARAGDAEGGASAFQEALAAAGAIADTERRAAAYLDVVTALNDRLTFLGHSLPDRGEARSD